MKYQKLIDNFELLSYSKEDYLEFHKELTNSHKAERQVNLLEYLRKCRGNYEDSQLNDEQLATIISPKNPVKKGTLRDLAHNLSKKIEDFLIHKELENDEFLRMQVIASLYKKRGNSKRFLNTTTQKVEKVMPDGEMAFHEACLLYTSPSPLDLSTSRMPSSA